MNNEVTLPEAAATGTDMRRAPDSVGYAINLMMDYGSGRQVTISGTLPLGATLPEMNAELDKLRMATNRQSSMVMRRDVENTVAMAHKTAASIELMMKAYDEEVEKEIARLGTGQTANHSAKKQQVENLRNQALNWRLGKKEEKMRAEADIQKGNAMLAAIDKEIEGG